MSEDDKQADAPALELSHIEKRFGTRTALNNLSLVVPAGTIAALVGPAGCGKTTALMVMAGFEAPNAGQVLIEDAVVTGVPAHRRPLATVFAERALFPHLDALGNVAYPLRRRGVRRQEALVQARESLDWLGLGALAKRVPRTLNAPEAFGVALARALVARPPVLLIDEPMDAMERPDREVCEDTLRRVRDGLGTTIVFTAREPRDAVLVAERIAVLQGGRLAQEGEPRDIYDNPVSVSVASLFGEANILRGLVRGLASGECEVALDSGLAVRGRVADNLRIGARATVALRPERIAIDPARGRFGNRFNAKVRECRFRGTHWRLNVQLSTGDMLAVRLPLSAPRAPIDPGSEIEVAFHARHARALRAD